MRIKKDTSLFILFSFVVPIAASIIFSSAGCVGKKVFRIGIVNVNAGHHSVVAGLKSGLAKAGFIEGKNVAYFQKGDLDLFQADDFLMELVKKKVDLIFVTTTPAAQKAQEAVKGTLIPVVFAPVLYPVGSGLVKSLTHPGGNLTGIRAGGNSSKALEWHKRILPGTKAIFVPCNCRDEAAGWSLSELQETAPKLGIRLIMREVTTVSELKAALDKIPAEADSIWLLNSPFLVSNIRFYVEAAAKHKLPLSSGTSQYGAGVMMSYGQDLFATGEQAAALAAKILQGIRPSELPVETAEFHLGINLRAARAAGVTISDDILQQAKHIVR
jgi:putative ABC transport system substrate-binding protein